MNFSKVVNVCGIIFVYIALGSQVVGLQSAKCSSVFSILVHDATHLLPRPYPAEKP